MVFQMEPNSILYISTESTLTTLFECKTLVYIYLVDLYSICFTWAPNVIKHIITSFSKTIYGLAYFINLGNSHVMLKANFLKYGKGCIFSLKSLSRIVFRLLVAFHKATKGLGKVWFKSYSN